MNANGHGQWEDTRAAYLLGALPGDELTDFETHLEACERCREEVGSLQVAVDVLAVAVPQVRPPDELKGRIMQVVDSDVFLPRVNVVPRVVTAGAIGRGLQHLYADMLKEPLPDELTALLERLARPPG